MFDAPLVRGALPEPECVVCSVTAWEPRGFLAEAQNYKGISTESMVTTISLKGIRATVDLPLHLNPQNKSHPRPEARKLDSLILPHL